MTVVLIVDGVRPHHVGQDIAVLIVGVGVAVRGIAVGIGHAEDLGGGVVRAYVHISEVGGEHRAVSALDRSGGGAPVSVKIITIGNSFHRETYIRILVQA